MWRRDHSEIGPSPLPDHLYAQRQLPVQRVLFWLGRTMIAIGMVGLILSVFIVSLYRMPDGKALLFWFSDYLPLPAVKVNSDTVALRDYRTVLDGWRKLYTSQGASPEQVDDVINSRVDDLVVQNVLIQQLMKERSLVLTEEQINTVYNEFVAQYQTEAHFIESIDRQFSWSQEEFLRLMVEPLARTRLLDMSVQSWAEAQGQPRGIIDDLHARVFTEAGRFAEIAQEVSTSLSASDGGELGLRSIDEYPVEVRSLLMELDEDELTSVIELADRFVIYKILERVERSSGVFVNARELAVDKRDIYDILDEKTESAEIEFYIK
ncbi:peptidylprolyl isomerase [Candidatus Uhrbacteria bacterium]|nr:peptidylprolyl isomerase [Candidatus Uhrbacteria bacterium]